MIAKALKKPATIKPLIAIDIAFTQVGMSAGTKATKQTKAKQVTTRRMAPRQLDFSLSEVIGALRLSCVRAKVLRLGSISFGSCPLLVGNIPIIFIAKPSNVATINDEFGICERLSLSLKAAAPAFTAIGQEGYTDIQLTQMRKVIARRLGESKFSAPHFYLTMEINMDNAMASRVAMNEVSPVKISFNDMVIKACAMALRKHPDVNSSWMGDFIRQNHHIHIGSAVAMPEGLIVPVIRFADQKSLSQIAGDAKELYAKAKDKKLQPAEFSGNTFTISNLGMMDIEEFTAIINPPDSAILAVGRIKEVVVKKGNPPNISTAKYFFSHEYFF